MFVSLLLLIAVGAAACTFEVQPIEKYTSADGYLSFNYPVAWDVLNEDISDGMTSARVGTHTDFVETVIAMEPFPAGEVWLQVGLRPNFFPEPSGEVVTLTAEEVAESIRQDSGGDRAGAGELESITLAPGKEAYTYAVSTELYDMSVYVFEPAEQVLAMVGLVTASGEDDAAMLAEVDEVLNSVQFKGDPDDFGNRAREVWGIDD